MFPLLLPEYVEFDIISKSFRLFFGYDLHNFIFIMFMFVNTWVSRDFKECNLRRSDLLEKGETWCNEPLQM